MSNEGLQAAVDAMIPIADQLRQGATYCEDSFVAAKNKAKVIEKTKTYTSQCLENFAGHVLNAMKEVDDLLKVLIWSDRILVSVPLVMMPLSGPTAVLSVQHGAHPVM